MKTVNKQLKISSKSNRQLINITEKIRKAVGGSGVKKGLANIWLPHATACLLVNEDEKGLKNDFLKLYRLIKKQGPFEHDKIDSNAASHLISGLAGAGLCLSIKDGDLVLGTWQSVMLLEADGPRERNINVNIIGKE